MQILEYSITNSIFLHLEMLGKNDPKSNDKQSDKMTNIKKLRLNLIESYFKTYRKSNLKRIKELNKNIIHYNLNHSF